MVLRQVFCRNLKTYVKTSGPGRLRRPKVHWLFCTPVGYFSQSAFSPFSIAFSLVFLDLPRFSQLSQHFTRLQKKIALGVRTRLTRLQVKPTNHSARHTSSESDSEQQVLYAVLSHLYLIWIGAKTFKPVFEGVGTRIGKNGWCHRVRLEKLLKIGYDSALQRQDFFYKNLKNTIFRSFWPKLPTPDCPRNLHFFKKPPDQTLLRNSQATISIVRIFEIWKLESGEDYTRCAVLNYSISNAQISAVDLPIVLKF